MVLWCCGCSLVVVVGRWWGGCGVFVVVVVRLLVKTAFQRPFECCDQRLTNLEWWWWCLHTGLGMSR